MMIYTYNDVSINWIYYDMFVYARFARVGGAMFPARLARGYARRAGGRGRRGTVGSLLGRYLFDIGDIFRTRHFLLLVIKAVT